MINEKICKWTWHSHGYEKHRKTDCGHRIIWSESVYGDYCPYCGGKIEAKPRVYDIGIKIK